ncbi:hypothetical protein BDQ17DRAFT_803626 [Cyathus striatus]|nr:hypothetical protein BDQ17DRAFT_803626 [Cyathus striatus]
MPEYRSPVTSPASMANRRRRRRRYPCFCLFRRIMAACVHIERGRCVAVTQLHTYGGYTHFTCAYVYSYRDGECGCWERMGNAQDTQGVFVPIPTCSYLDPWVDPASAPPSPLCTGAAQARGVRGVVGPPKAGITQARGA